MGPNGEEIYFEKAGRDGGCSGFEYGFNFDEQRKDDQVVEIGGVKVFLDPISLPYLQKKSTVDWADRFS